MSFSCISRKVVKHTSIVLRHFTWVFIECFDLTTVIEVYDCMIYIIHKSEGLFWKTSSLEFAVIRVPQLTLVL